MGSVRVIEMTRDYRLPQRLAQSNISHNLRDNTVHSMSQRERVARDVIQGLYEGRFEPGQRLIESHLTAAYETSRSTLREALNQLAALGIVELTQQRGAQIRMLSIQEAIDSLVVVEALCALASRLAAANIEQPGARELLREATERVTAFDPSSGSIEHTLARDNFYATLTAIANNSELRRVLPNIGGHLFRIQFQSILRSVDQRRHADYKRIAEAVLAGRPATAEAAVRAHISRTKQSLISFRDGKPS